MAGLTLTLKCIEVSERFHEATNDMWLNDLSDLPTLEVGKEYVIEIREAK